MFIKTGEMAMEEKIVESKEEVFAIMGKYYGNAYWRDAVGCYTVETCLFLVEILDRINALGYNFSNLHRLTDHEDIRFIPIVLEYIPKKKWVGSLLDAFHCRSYYKYTPELIALWKNPEGGNYLCIEPWSSPGTYSDPSGLLEKRKGITLLEAGETAEYGYKITII
jgi:hypothetical protein